MPPRRAKRPKTSKSASDEQSTPTTVSASVTTQEIIRAPVNNGDNGKCKFVEMPLELLLEIMSYFPAVPVPTSRRYNTPVLPPSIFERWDTLRALSQTCKLWRSIFYPMLWERMEACAIRETKKDDKNTKGGNNNSTAAAAASTSKKPLTGDLEVDVENYRRDEIPTSWYKGVSRLLENVSKGLAEDPQAAQHVRTVNVSLTRCSPYTVLPAFVACLENLPNLHTLQILRAHTQMTSMLKNTFEGHTLPTVRTIIVPEHGQEILRCCPNVRKVTCNYGEGSKIITAIGKCCKNVEVLEGILADKNYLKRLAKACPKLRELVVYRLDYRDETTPTDLFTALAAFKHLTRFEIQMSKSYKETYLTDPLVAQLIRGGKKLLDNGVEGRKTFRLFYTPKWNQTEAWSLDVPV